jgi:hypothetical protein
MGQTTPNIGIYIPAAGETNYSDAFASGMINIDQHDHSGGPNKGLPITSTGLADFSVTYNKLNSNVADVLTGIGTEGAPFQNRLTLLGILKNLFQLASVPGVGFVAMNGATVNARTFQNTATSTWTNPDGSAGNPQVDFNIAGISPVTVPNGGTGVTTLNAWDILLGGTTSTGPIQQVVGEGILNQYLASQGPGVIPAWQTLPAFPTQNFQIATVNVNASQFNNMGSVPIVLVPSPGPGKVVLVSSVWGKLNYGASDSFHNGSSVRLYWGSSSNEVGFVWKSVSFKDIYTGYYYADNTQDSSTTGIPFATMENQSVTISTNSTAFSGGAGNTVSFSCQYSIMQI